jgi:hypothetical protein
MYLKVVDEAGEMWLVVGVAMQERGWDMWESRAGPSNSATEIVPPGTTNEVSNKDMLEWEKERQGDEWGAEMRFVAKLLDTLAGSIAYAIGDARVESAKDGPRERDCELESGSEAGLVLHESEWRPWDQNPAQSAPAKPELHWS